MTAQWSLDHLVGYFRTWSSTQRFIAAKGTDPLEQIIDELRGAWGNPQQARSVIWPLTLRVGVINACAAGGRALFRVLPKINSAKTLEWNRREQSNRTHENTIITQFVGRREPCAK